MESTHQDIELIYFTKSIEYYKYLLDDTIPKWFVGLDNAVYNVINGDFMYVANTISTKINKISMTDQSNIIYDTQIENITGMIFYNDNIYISCLSGTIYKSDLSLDNFEIWANVNQCAGLLIDDSIEI